MRPVRPGRMRDRVTLQRKVRTGQATNGADQFAWEDAIVGVSAEVVCGQSREFTDAQQTMGELSHLVKIRYIPSIPPQRLAGMRVIYYGQVLEQVAPPIDRENRKREVTLYTKEIFDHE